MDKEKSYQMPAQNIYNLICRVVNKERIGDVKNEN